jgi:FlaA1/EpsC-like NDP-sugar epimerase
MAEACQLILQASVAGSGQAIYVLNMGEPVKISDLAEQMIRLAGLRTDKDIRIEFTGLRPGEKLKEELFHDLESLSPTGFEKLLLADRREVERETVLDGCRQLVDACNDYDYQTIVRVMQCLVPEYREAKNDRSEGAKVQAIERGKDDTQDIKSPTGATGDLRAEPLESRRS